LKGKNGAQIFKRQHPLIAGFLADVEPFDDQGRGQRGRRFKGLL
jgi:hypothetical protein